MKTAGARSIVAILSLSAVGACGDDGNSVATDAAALVDASDTVTIDADIDAAAPAGCSMQVGAAGVSAVLHNADGTVHGAVVTTDAAGLASFASCAADSMVSYVSYDAASGFQGVTVAGVQPGSNFELLLDDVGLHTTAQVDIPVDASDITMIRVSAGQACSKNTTEGATAELPITSLCVGDDDTVLPVLASGRIGTTNIYSFQTDAAVVAGGTTTVNGMSGWMTGGQFTVSATNVAQAQIFATIQHLKNGKPYSGLLQLVNVANNEASQGLPLPPSGFTTEKRVGVQTNGLAKQGITRLAQNATESFDMSALLPEITALTVDNTDDERPVFTLTGDTSASELVSIYSSWVGGADDDVVWRLIAPAGATTSVTFPVLPTELVDALPNAASASSATVIDVTGMTFETILSGGYNPQEFIGACPRLGGSNECNFSSLQNI